MTTPFIILILLSSPLFFAFLISKIKGSSLDVRKHALWGLGICFIFFSIGHAVKAAKAAIMVFIVFFPANIYAAVNATGLGGHQWGPIYLLIRLPLQLILIAWAYFLCIKDRNKLSRHDV